METVGHILQLFGKGLLIVWGILIVCIVIWWVFFRRKGEYSSAREEIFAYVKAYKRKCTGNNRFVVTVPVLQDAFREYETEVINKVWLELVKERVIEQDGNDGEWCIR